MNIFVVQAIVEGERGDRYTVCSYVGTSSPAARTVFERLSHNNRLLGKRIHRVTRGQWNETTQELCGETQTTEWSADGHRQTVV
jgi:hypothetical protein